MLPFTSRDKGQDDGDFLLELYEKFQRLIYSTARKYVPQEAEDLMQDVLLRLYRPDTLSTLRSMGDPAQAFYIYKTVVSMALNLLKKQQRRIRAEAGDREEEDVADIRPTPEEYALAAERSEEFVRCFQRLGEEDRILLEGKYHLELSDRELAQILGCKPGSVRMKLTRARRRAFQVFQEGAMFHDQG